MRVENPKLGIVAPDFSLPSTEGKTLGLSDVMGENGAVVVFICNHCPYVKAITDRLNADALTLKEKGIGFVAICSNDASSHPEDSFENMVIFAEENGFVFPYLHDESQAVARAYDAQCTPDFFGLNRDGLIEYRGRIDKGRMNPLPAGAKRDLVLAMEEIALTGKGPAEQIPSAGCSIKWKQD
ncbi:MAG TPA: thioredoxin family protein [Devosia sp.]|nr:thioredoxin family protein [Devosia sp.]